jgi:hypothetical protein
LVLRLKRIGCVVVGCGVVVDWWLSEGALNRREGSNLLIPFALLLVMALALSRSDVNLVVAVAHRGQQQQQLPPSLHIGA